MPRPDHRLGRRGRCLLFFALLDLIYGASLADPDAETRPGTFLDWMATVTPLWTWAALWIVAGLICLWYAFQQCDRVGYTAAIFIKVVWGLACIGAWLVGDVERGYAPAAIWLAFALLVANLAGWPEPPAGERRPMWKRRSSSPSSPESPA
jgi:hypothetical protein